MEKKETITVGTCKNKNIITSCVVSPVSRTTIAIENGQVSLFYLHVDML
jgi:hypothetical protein